MKITFLLFVILTAIICSTIFAQQNFLSEQRNFPRVRAAITEKGQSIKENLQNNGLTINNVHILIIAYKAEKELEIWAKEKKQTVCKLLADYQIVKSSGIPGPKRREGDMQVPEGFYKIDRFNPTSNFHLSLGINYPNQSDRIKSNAKSLGGDIFIHGSEVTIGCLPMTDDKIKEIYLYAVCAKNNGQNNIPVYIFPFRMTDDTFNIYKKRYENNQELIDFWTNLKTGYDKFFLEKKSLNTTVDELGNYKF